MKEKKMKKDMRGFILVCLAFLLMISFTACGGSSDSDGGGSLTYTGITSQAAVTSTNASDLATDAYQGGNTGSGIGGATGTVEDGADGQNGLPRTILLSRTLGNALRSIDLASGGIAVGATSTYPMTGNCTSPGSATMTITDDGAGNCSGSIEFNAYCEDGVTISGSVSFSGSMDMDTGELMQFTMSFNNLTTSSFDDSFTADGTITFVITATDPMTMSMTINMLMNDNTTGKVWQVENYIAIITEGSDITGAYVDIELSGRFYAPDYGFVDISTTTPLRIYEGDENPSSGELRIDGAGSTYARLVVIDNTSFEVFADTTGDGIENYYSGVLLWDEV